MHRPLAFIQFIVMAPFILAGCGDGADGDVGDGDGDGDGRVETPSTHVELGAGSGNLTSNPSFETTAGGWTGWQSTISRVALSDAPDGSYVARVARGATGTSYSIDDAPDTVSSATAGTTYKASARVRMAAGSRPMNIAMREIDGAGTIVNKVVSPTTTVGTSFVDITASLKATQSGTKIDMYVYQSSAVAGDVFYADLLTMTASAPDAPLWKGDAETGNLSQWASHTMAANKPWMIQVISPQQGPVFEGKYGYRFETRWGDAGPFDNAQKQRAELGMGNPGAPGYPLINEGDEHYYGFAVRFPAGFPIGDWQVVAQWKKTAPAGWPEVSMKVTPDGLAIDNNHGTTSGGGSFIGAYPVGAFKTDVWIKFVVHIKFHSDPTIGFVEAWRGEGSGPMSVVLNKKFTHTHYGAGSQSHARVGLYRSANPTTGIVYIDGFKWGKTYASVAP